MRQLRHTELRTTQQVNHVCGTIQPSYSISRIVVAMMEAGAITLEGTHQAVSRTTTIVKPAGEGTQILYLFR